MVYNFTASAKGCVKPCTVDLFGPKRIWEYPRIFRSNKVTKATATNDIIIKINRFNDK